MADWNDQRGGRSGGGGDRWRDERSHNARDRSGGGEGRSFGGGDEGEHEPWRRDRYGSLHDQDRTNYGSGWDRERGGYGQGSQDRGGDRSFDRDRRNTQGGHHDYEPDYLHWRDQRLRMHDRDYEQWRNDQHRRYDDDYHTSRSRSAGTGHWQEQGRAGGTSERNYITPETHDYGSRLYQEGVDRPTGRLEFGPGRGGGGGGHGGQARQRPSGGGGGGGFMQSSPQVRAASEGWGGRGDPEEYDRRWREQDHDMDDHDRDRGRRWDRDR